MGSAPSWSRVATLLESRGRGDFKKGGAPEVQVKTGSPKAVPHTAKFPFPKPKLSVLGEVQRRPPKRGLETRLKDLGRFSLQKRRRRTDVMVVRRNFLTASSPWNGLPL